MNPTNNIKDFEMRLQAVNDAMDDMCSKIEWEEEPFVYVKQDDGTIKYAWKHGYVDFARELESGLNRKVIPDVQHSGTLWDIIEQYQPVTDWAGDGIPRQLMPTVSEKYVEVGFMLSDIVTDGQEYITMYSKYGNCNICRRSGIVGTVCEAHIRDIFRRGNPTEQSDIELGTVNGKWIPHCGDSYMQGIVCRFTTPNGKKAINPFIIEMMTDRPPMMTSFET